MSYWNNDKALSKQIEMMDEALEIMKRKRVDYSGEQDPFANFRFSLLYDIPPYLGAMVRMTDKLSRIYQLMERGGQGLVVDESLYDTFLDLINYACITYMLCLEYLYDRQINIDEGWESLDIENWGEVPEGWDEND